MQSATKPKSKPSVKGPKSDKPSLLDPAAIIAAARAAAFTDAKPEAAFSHFRDLAKTVETDGLAIFTGQPLVLRANVMTALSAIETHLPTAVGKLREPRLEEIFELPSLVMALEFAATRVPLAKLSAGDIDRMLQEGAPWRELMLSFLEVVSHPLLALVPRERVAAIRAGSGKLDKARDFVAVPGLFAECAEALSGKHPFPADKIELLATLGAVLVQEIKPGRARAAATKRSDEAILRDQLAYLVAERYDHLQVLTSVAIGRRKADELLPALRSTAGFVFSAGLEQAPETVVPA